MNRDTLIELFDKYLEAVKLCAFDSVENKYSQRADLHAFILLDKIFPDNKDLIVRSDSYSIYFGIDIDEISKVITEEQIDELVKCGVSYDSHYDCLYMMV